MLKLLLKNLLFTIVVPGTVAVYVPLFLISHSSISFGAWLVLGLFLLLLGSAIYLWCIYDFSIAGHGTPGPIDPPKELVVRGLYRYTRNPMYVGILCVILGWALIFWSSNIAIYALFLGVAFHLFVLLYEEPHLRKVFGSSYERYCSQVDRWLPSIRNK